MSTDDVEIKTLVLKLYNRLDKIEQSPALNGGFSALATDVKTLTGKVDGLIDDVKNLENKVDKVYDPEDGVYPKMMKVEHSLTSVKEKLKEEVGKTEKQEELNLITKQLKTIGGEGLSKIEKTISFHETFSRFYWILLGAFAIQVVNILVTFLKK
jgi:predicted  nucleic acid-binding Zn-ribbon protein